MKKRETVKLSEKGLSGMTSFIPEYITMTMYSITGSGRNQNIDGVK